MIILNLLLLAALFFVSFRRGLIYLQIAQQDEYNPERLFDWYKEKKAFDKQISILAIGAIIVISFFDYSNLVVLFTALAFYQIANLAIDPRVSAKLKLNFTERATKIWKIYLLVVSFFLLLALLLICNQTGLLVFSLIWAQVLPAIMMLALAIQKPFELKLQEKFIAEATKKYQDSDVFTIAVTGSYGKTSVKIYLGEILQTTHGSTFWPREGINSIMGITRSIRERFNRRYRFAVIEIGAYYIGSIARVCKMTPPKISIITAIGKQHLERFGGQDNLYTAKTEIAHALDDNGILICNADSLLANKAGLTIKKKKNILYGLKEQSNLDYHAKDIKFTLAGSEAIFCKGDQQYSIKTRLLGSAAISNLLASFAAADQLGADLDLVVAAIATLEPVNNRLALEKAGDVHYLMDAYNSNEVGFLSALDVLGKLPAERRIIMTPGVIEIGERQREINKELAEAAAKVCDYVIVVGPVNREAFMDGIGDDQLIVAADRTAAFIELEKLKIPGTIILLENDLTDFHEARYRF